jgi:hypothetical protein
MGSAWRSLALAAALNTVLAAGLATAQTVTAVGAPRGSAVELTLNDAKIGTATADASGAATFPLTLVKPDSKTELNLRVVVDTCDALHRVHLFEPNQELSPVAPGCTRRQFTELFIIRQVTTLVVDVFPERQAVWVRQGRPPSGWLNPSREDIAPPRALRPSPRGLVFSGGAGLAAFSNAVSVTCGDAQTCAGGGSQAALSGSVAYWFTRFAAVEAAFLKPASVWGKGSGSGYEFESSFETLVFVFGGKGGYSYGPIRLYGQGGATYSRTMLTTNETFDDYTYTSNNVTSTLIGGEQTFVLRTSGWGWMFGGGGEYWITRWLGVYGEVSRLALKGGNRDVGEGSVDERITSVVGGIRFSIGR